MANQHDVVKSVQNTINSVISALDYYTDSDGNASIYLTDNTRLNVINFIIDFFNQTKGRDWLVNTLSDYIAKYLPELEITTKSILLGYIASMQSCSVSPIITEQMIRDGVYFDLQSIDLFNKLKYAPVLNANVDDNNTNAGKYLYFGCNTYDGINIISDLVKCRDFDAFIWYTKNCPGTRMIWKDEKYADDKPVLYSFGLTDKVFTVKQTKTFMGKSIAITKICKQSRDKDGNIVYKTFSNEIVAHGEYGKNSFTVENDFYDFSSNTVYSWAKQGKRNGIVTLEYNARASNMTDAEHQLMYIPEPIQNCLHVFIGCCGEISPDIETYTNNLNIQYNKLKDLKQLKNDINDVIKCLNIKRVSYEQDTMISHHDEIRQLIHASQNLQEFVIAIENNTDTIIDIARKKFHVDGNHIIIQELENSEYGNTISIPASIINESQYSIELDTKLYKRQITEVQDKQYPSVQSNYYLNHSLLEFNSDLIFSMKWFDEKVVTAQIINALTGCLEFGDANINSNGLVSVNLSLQEQIVQSELREIVERIIENDDEVMNDCFFTFDNDKFNKMLQSYEMKRIGLHTLDGENPIIPASPSELMEAINRLAPNATKEELKSAIVHSIFSALSTQDKNTDSSEFNISTKLNGAFGMNFSTNVNVFEVLIKKLVYVITSTFLMPKIYMVIMLNLKILGNSDASFNIEQFITYCKSMFVDIIKSIRDQIIGYFKDLLLKTIQDLLLSYQPLLFQEQYKYYETLYNSCIECFRIHGNEYEWSQDAVNYADITDPITSTETQC